MPEKVEVGLRSEGACRVCGSLFGYYPSQSRGFFCSRQCMGRSRWGAGSTSHKYDKVQIIEAMECLKKGGSYAEAAKLTGLPKKYLTDIVCNNYWPDIDKPTTKKEAVASLPPLNEKQISVLVGSLLGDGSIGTPRTSGTKCKMRKSQISCRAEYLEWHGEIFGNYSKRLTYNRAGKVCTFSTIHHQQFSDYRKIWYPLGKKIVPTEVELTPISVAVWYCDDGHLSKKSRTIYLSTNCFSENEVDDLCGKLLRMGVGGVARGKDQKKQPIIRIGTKGYDTFLDIVRPNIPFKCFQYKCLIR